MDFPTTIDILFVESGTGEYVDREHDAPAYSMNGFFTWRRSHQPRSESFVLVATIDFDDALPHLHEALEGPSITLLDRMIAFGKGKLTRDEATAIAAHLFDDIRASYAQHGDNWGYYHSHIHVELVRSNKELDVDGPLQPWELDLLYGRSDEQ